MANAQTSITLTHGTEAYETIVDKMLTSSGTANKELILLRNFFHSAAGGNRSVKATIQINSGNAVNASATLTVASGATSDTAVVSGTTFTCVDHRETTNVTFGADSSGSLNSKYFTFEDKSGAFKYYLWFSINNAGVDPSLAGRVGIKVIGATGATAATLATAAVTATAGTDSAKVTFGADSSGSLNSTFFTFRDQANKNRYYIWFNINGAGIDPGAAGTNTQLQGRTGIMIAGATGASAATLATAAFNACTKVSGVYVVNPSSGVLNFYGLQGDLAAIVHDGITAPTQFVMVEALQNIVFSAGASGHIITTDVVPGVAVATLDGAGTSTGFTFTRSITGSAITSVQYQLGATDTLTATNLTSQINSNNTMQGLTQASSLAGVVTVSSFFPGTVGNYITLTATGNVSASAATLSGGSFATQNTPPTTFHSGV